MIYPKHSGKLLGLAGFLYVCAAPASVRADVTVTPDVSFANGLYHYDYSVFNDTLSDLAIVSINVTPGSGSILNLSNPAGFQTSFDSGLGIVDFISDSSVFSSMTTVSGFVFDSPIAPHDSAFSALTLEGDTVIGPTQAPFVPEPGAMAIVGAMTTTGLLAARRRTIRSHRA